MSPEDHLRAQIERLRVQLLEVNKALELDRDNTDNTLRVTTALRLRAGTGGSAWRNALADCANALAECIGRDDPRWKVVESANRLLDDTTKSKRGALSEREAGSMNESLPSDEFL